MHNKLNCKESWCITLSYFLLLVKQLLKREVNNYTFTKLWHNILIIIFYCKFTYLVVLAKHSLSAKKASLLFTTLFSVNIALMNTNRDHNDISYYDAKKSCLIIIILTILITTSPRNVQDKTVTRNENFHFGLMSDKSMYLDTVKKKRNHF